MGYYSEGGVRGGVLYINTYNKQWLEKREMSKNYNICLPNGEMVMAIIEIIASNDQISSYVSRKYWKLHLIVPSILSV